MKTEYECLLETENDPEKIDRIFDLESNSVDALLHRSEVGISNMTNDMINHLQHEILILRQMIREIKG